MAGELVLVVEDNEKNMKLFRDLLQATGYRTMEATTGEQALETGVNRPSNLRGTPVVGHDRADQATQIVRRSSKGKEIPK